MKRFFRKLNKTLKRDWIVVLAMIMIMTIAYRDKSWHIDFRKGSIIRTSLRNLKNNSRIASKKLDKINEEQLKTLRFVLAIIKRQEVLKKENKQLKESISLLWEERVCE